MLSAFAPTTHHLTSGLTRGLAGAMGLFALTNAVGEALRPGFDATIWWLDLRPLPAPAVLLLSFIAGAVLLAQAVWPARSARRWRATCGIALMLALIALYNVVTYYLLLWSGALHAGPWVPLSLPLLAALLAVALGRGASRSKRATGVGLVVTVGVVLLGAWGVMWTFGKADYRRPADAIVVFGARAYADGRPSDALADRVNTAIALYHQGYAHTLVMSGGPGDGAYHETHVMRNMAIAAGVPAEAILTDELGLNTARTVDNTTPMFASHGLHRVLAVSHGYHLPRIKLTYQRAGVEVYTVPAHETYMLTQLPYNMAREAAAWWVYYIKALG